MKQCLGLAILLFFCGCQISTPRKSNETVPTKVLDKANYSLAADRSQFDEIRSEIDKTMQTKNDERALYAEWMLEEKKSPEEIREKFNNLVRKKREKFNNDITKIREEYSKNEKKQRDQLSEELAQDRENIKEQDISREKRNDLYEKIDTKRRDFYSEQRQARDEFEADIREKRKDFDDYIKEKTDDFNQELKNYSVRWKEKQKVGQ